MQSEYRKSPPTTQAPSLRTYARMDQPRGCHRKHPIALPRSTRRMSRPLGRPKLGTVPPPPGWPGRPLPRNAASHTHQYGLTHITHTLTHGTHALTHGTHARTHAERERERDSSPGLSGKVYRARPLVRLVGWFET